MYLISKVNIFIKNKKISIQDIALIYTFLLYII